MKLKTIILVLLFGLFGFQSYLFARLGETEQEIQKRYGAPTKTMTMDETMPPETVALLPDLKTILAGMVKKEYQFNGYTVSVLFIKGVCKQEIYTKQWLINDDDEVSALLNANALGSKWKQVQSDDANKHWALESGAATALIRPVEPAGSFSLVISAKEVTDFSAQLQKMLADKEAELKAKKMQGF